MENIPAVMVGWKTDKSDIASFLGCKILQLTENEPIKKWKGNYRGTAYFSQTKGMLLVQPAKLTTVRHFIGSILDYHKQHETPITKFGVPILTLHGGEIVAKHKHLGLESFKPNDTILIKLLSNSSMRKLIQFQTFPKVSCYVAYHPKFTQQDLELLKISAFLKKFPEYDFIRRAYRISLYSDKEAKQIASKLEHKHPCTLLRLKVRDKYRWDVLFQIGSR